MSNPFTSPSITGYNSSPPADDGTQTSSNEISWSKHKTKLADPIKTLAETTVSNVASAFGKIFGNDVKSLSSSYTVLAADQGKFFDCSATLTLTLIAAASAGAGFLVHVFNSGSGTVTIDGNASETINGSTTIDLPADGWAILTCDGSNWAGSTFVASGVTAGSYTAANITVDALGRVTSAADGNPGGVQVFTASGTWTCPSGVTKAWITAIGGGGGGSDGTTSGTDGGNTSVGALVTANGGTGGATTGNGVVGGSPNGQGSFNAVNGGYFGMSAAGSTPFGEGGEIAGNPSAGSSRAATGYGAGGHAKTPSNTSGGSGGWYVDSEQTVSSGNYTVTIGAGGAGGGTAEAGTDGLVIVRW